MDTMKILSNALDNQPVNPTEFALKPAQVPALPSKMAFQVIFRSEAGNISLEDRVPYPGQPFIFKGREHFTPEASRPTLNSVVNTSYGFLKFSARGVEDRKALVELINKYRETGWVLNAGTPKEEQFRPIYSDVNGDDAWMLLVSMRETYTDRGGVTHKVASLSDLGLWVSSDRKAGKRVRRELSNAKWQIEGRVIGHHEEANGTLYKIKITRGPQVGEIIDLMNVNMDRMDGRTAAFFDGSVVVNLPGFRGGIVTVTGPFGQAKGTGYSVPLMDAHQIYCYGLKSEIADSRGRVRITCISEVGLGELWSDMQSVTNMGAWDVIVEYGIAMLDEYADIMLDGTQDQVCDLFAQQARLDEAAYLKRNGDKPRWSTMQYLKGDIGFDRISVILKRLFMAGFDNLIKIDKCRVPVKDGLRAYARWNPLCVGANGLPDFAKDELGPMTHDGLPCVCIPDAPEGRVLLARNPNTHPGEFILVWNVHLAGLMIYKGGGWVFFGANAGELMSKLNGGDMDDGLMVIWDARIIATWLTMEYPVCPKVADPKAREINAKRKARREKLTGVSEVWNWAVFKTQLDNWVLPTDSLGGFINKLWIDMLTSGEHREAIGECLDNEMFDGLDFQPPTVADLKALCLPDDMAYLADGYDETPAGFLKVCKLFNEKKRDFRGASAAWNSDKIIDMEVMGKGDEATVRKLYAQAADLMRMPYFPMCFANRVPTKRKMAGNYILVETKLCKAMATLQDRYNEILEELAEMKKLSVLELPKQLVEAYPVDERTAEDAAILSTWFHRGMVTMREEGRMEKKRGVNKHQWYADLADGEKRVVKHMNQVDRVHANHVEIERIPGLMDFYAFQFEPSEDKKSLVPSTNRRSIENRRALAIQMFNAPYLRGRDSDGYPDFMLQDLYNAMKELDMVGRRVFVAFNHEGHTYADRLKDGEKMDVWVSEGILYHLRNNRPLTDVADAHLPSGPAKVSKAGVILVKACHPELAAGRKAALMAEVAKGGFIG